MARIESSNLLVLRIPRATRTQRPVYLGGNPHGNTFRRRHEGDYRCTDAEVRRMLADADELPRDHRILTGYSIADLDPASLAQYRRRLQLAKGDDHPWVALDDRDLLERFGSRVDRLDSSELQALATAYLEGAVSNSRLQQLQADHRVDITRMLAGLCGQGLLVSDRRRRWTTYQLPPIDFAASAPSTDSVALGAGPGDSGHLPGDSGHLPGDSGHLSGDSGHLPGDADEELVAAAAPVAALGKAPASQIRDVIVTLCRQRFLTPAQLGKLLDRNPEGIRKRHLIPMVREGRLRLRFPEATHRPDQAYTAGQDPE